MRLASGAGHSPNCDGARGCGYSENAEAQKLDAEFRATANAAGLSCASCSSSAPTQRGYLLEQSRLFNQAGADVSLQWHLNSGGGQGCEVLYNPKMGSRDVAAAMSAAMARATGLKDRGAKARTDLWILNSVPDAYIMEVAFIDSASDMAAIQGKYPAIAQAVLGAITGEEDEMQLSDKLNDTPLPDGTNNNVANVLDRTRRNSDAILERLEAMGDAGQVIDYDRLADAVADKLAARLSQ